MLLSRSAGTSLTGDRKKIKLLIWKESVYQRGTHSSKLDGFAKERFKISHNKLGLIKLPSGLPNVEHF